MIEPATQPLRRIVAPEPARHALQPPDGPDRGNGSPREPAGGTGGPDGFEDDDVDDFRRIGGVGPKAARALRAAGIVSFQDLAGSDEGTLRTIMREAGLRHSASLATWPHQAALLASDDFTLSRARRPSGPASGTPTGPAR